jgi:hypothetical protein
MKATMKRRALRGLLDLALAAGFVLLLGGGGSGLAFHQILGIGFGAGIAVHLVINWRWVVNVTRKLGGMPRRTRTNYIVDLVLLGLVALTILTGVVMSPWLGLVAAGSMGGIHGLLTVVMLITLTVHTGLHWRWIVGTVRGLRPGNRRMVQPEA